MWIANRWRNSPFNQKQITEQVNFAYSPLGEAFEKQAQKQLNAIKSLDPSNKLKQIESMFQQNLMNYLSRAKLKVNVGNFFKTC